MRCAFSAPANYRAACIAQSRAAFVAKLSLAFEERDETVFWLECIQQAALFESERMNDLMKEEAKLAKISAAAWKNSQ